MTTTTIPAATDLESLLAILRTYELSDQRWTCLPTFGGEEPRNCSGVWSWDAKRLLVGTCADDLRIVAREDWDERGRYIVTDYGITVPIDGREIE